MRWLTTACGNSVVSRRGTGGCSASFRRRHFERRVDNDLYEALKAHLEALGDDVQIKTLKNYFAFKRIKNLACVEMRNRTRISRHK